MTTLSIGPLQRQALEALEVLIHDPDHISHWSIAPSGLLHVEVWFRYGNPVTVVIDPEGRLLGTDG